MDIEVHHKCKAEFHGDAQPAVAVDNRSVSVSFDGSRLSLTHDQFKEIVRVYNAYVHANIVAQEQIKE